MQTFAFSSWKSQGCTTIGSPSAPTATRIFPGMRASRLSPSSQTALTGATEYLVCNREHLVHLAVGEGDANAVAPDSAALATQHRPSPPYGPGGCVEGPYVKLRMGIQLLNKESTADETKSSKDSSSDLSRTAA
ncbi:MAG: hypothetical protein Ct9H300mP30_2100 [Methanobacteriota archaeon]|nr:MAG: hypothetical protein Ct9H300mP30_2100 [Euryarchaeota archaeon]